MAKDSHKHTSDFIYKPHKYFPESQKIFLYELTYDFFCLTKENKFKRHKEYFQKAYYMSTDNEPQKNHESQEVFSSAQF